jgi:hypothetical protein
MRRELRPMHDEDELRVWKHDLVDAAAELGIRIDPDEAAVSAEDRGRIYGRFRYVSTWKGGETPEN